VTDRGGASTGDRADGGDPFQYAVLRIVPRVERGESLNAGVILLCRPQRFLAARIGLDTRRLQALAPDVDPATIAAHLALVERIAAGDSGAGPIAGLTIGERFHFLVSPSSTVIQPSEVHTGLCDDPAQELDHLFDRLVR
jgi:hypothetical protein